MMMSQCAVGAGMENEKFLYDINEVEESDVVSPDPTTTTSTSSTSSTTTGPSPSPSSRTSKSNKPKKQKKTPAVVRGFHFAFFDGHIYIVGK